ncbi:hypothetical protein BDZ94DRAFT_918106 [Collybia nuda]|uniref:Pentatricopeptide repeat-containing protein n=1 Tax=Collybia nuda TaxID=64659 RepID=A0A9P5YFJ1_9AGAR|nr:hypothetical protein BDZ94DRAFT_918106 [Collybia nuda]
MLAASWALVHPPWIPTLRLSLRWDIVSRSVSQSKAPASRPRYLPSKPPFVILRHSHISQVPTDELVNLVAEGKYQLAEKLRMELLEMGVEIPGGSVYEGVVEELIRKSKIEDITQEFTNWLALLPEARCPDDDMFHGIRQLLQASPEANLPLIIQFGMVCASKGYTVIVNEEITPIVARYADARTYAQFAKGVEVRSRDHHTKSEPERPIPYEAVFEDVSDDYNIVNSEATPPPPNVLNLITENLPEILPRPVPNDTMVFEDESNYDYISYASTSPPTSLPDALSQLVSDHRYEEAYRFLVEIQDVGGIAIHQSLVYEKAARSVLGSSSTLTPQECIKRFTSWLSLIPPVHVTQPPAQFLEIRQLIFRAPYPNYLLASRFATILASKGYGDLIIPHAVPLIMRFAPENTSHQFVLDFERADKAYWTKFKPDEALEKVMNTKCELRTTAVKHLTYANRLGAAISLLPKVDDHFHLKPAIYDNLIRSLKRSHTHTSISQLSLVETLRNQEAQLITTRFSSLDRKTNTAKDEFFDLSPKDFGQDIGRAILYLRKALTSKDNLPDPLALSEWFEFYHSSSSKRKRRAITTLRNKALQYGGRNAETYLFAEMHYYQRTGNYDLVIKTFADHFYLIGVPQGDVLRHYQRVKQSLANKYQNEDLPKELTSAPHIGDRPNFKLARRKLWPKHTHTTLVWHTLLNLTTSDADAEKLYQKLVQIATSGSDTSLATPDDSPLLPPPSWTHNVGTAAFTPFIRKLMIGHGASRGAMVLSDMLKVGLEPTLHQFTELAGLYARLGDAPRAFMILDRMEANKARPLAEPDAQVDRTTPSPTSHHRSVGSSFPAPDVVLYTSLLRGFLISRDLQAIDEVDRRLKKFHQYTPGENAALDEVYTKAVRLRKEFGRPDLNDVDD